jgi:dihydrolipoamide dehydrogenase
MTDSAKKRVVIIGAGPGGYTAAYLAADLGFDVTLIDERANPGGVCLHVGCIPSKAMLHIAKLINESHEAANWGLDFGKVKINVDDLRAWKDSGITKLTSGLSAMNKIRGVNFVQGRAQFVDSNTVSVTETSGQQQRIEFDYAVIATGSLPARPGSLWLDSSRVWDSTSALELPRIPKSLLVIGGGYIGLEMGTVYAALGSKVSVVEMASEWLPGTDSDLAGILRKQTTPRFEEVLLDTRVTEMKEGKDGIELKLIGLDLEQPNRKYDTVLISVGRTPNTAGLGLENTSVKLTDRGFIETDAQRRSSESHIFAIGDVAGEPGLAHKATHESRVAVETIAGKPAEFDAQSIPAVVFTDPEMAWCGITEAAARDRNIDHKVARFPWAASGRAVTVGRSEGMTKFIVDPHTERILGVGIVGANCGDLIAEASLAVEMGATAQDMARTIHPHPTFSETIMETAEVFYGHSAHYQQRGKP